jgi:D-alanyl-D-alanine dipeptidase
MTDPQSRVKTWARVPGGATLRIRVSGTTETESLRATVDALSSANDKKLKVLNTATGAAFDLTLEKDTDYSVDIIAEFDTAATATVHAEILVGDEDRHGKPFDREVRGRRGAEEFFTLHILAARS